MVLGVQWMIELGTVKTNYKELTMEFTYGGKDVKLQGECMLTTTPIRGKAINKLVVADEVIEFYQLQTIINSEGMNGKELAVPDSIEKLLLQY